MIFDLYWFGTSFVFVLKRVYFGYNRRSQAKLREGFYCFGRKTTIITQNPCAENEFIAKQTYGVKSVRLFFMIFDLYWFGTSFVFVLKRVYFGYNRRSQAKLREGFYCFGRKTTIITQNPCAENEFIAKQTYGVKSVRLFFCY